MSSYIASVESHFAIDAAGTSQDMLEIVRNIVSIKEFPKEINFGGDPSFQYTGIAYQSLVFPIYREIDGTNIGGLTFELHFMAFVTPGDTITVQLWNRTALTSVVEVETSASILSLIKSDPFTLPASEVEYEVRVKASLGGGSRPYRIYNCTLVQK